MHWLIQSFDNYGYAVLIICLMLEMIALPLPGEALMAYCGYVIYLQKMSLSFSILSAAVGAVLGVNLSYLIGKVIGTDFFQRNGSYICLSKKRLDKISMWFQRYGTWFIFISYFIPGIRHIVGYFSGITRISYRNFALGAYTGAFVWTATFISLGDFLGTGWSRHHMLKKYIILVLISVAIIAVIVYAFKKYRNYIYKGLKAFKEAVPAWFDFILKRRVVAAGIAFLIFMFLVILIDIV